MLNKIKQKFSADKKLDVREVTYGIQDGYWAPIMSDGSFGKISRLIGFVSCNLSPQIERQPIYADNQEHVVLYGNETIEGDIVLRQLGEKFYLHACGRGKSKTGMIYNASAPKPFAFWFINWVQDEFGNSTKELQIFYNVTVGLPQRESQTNNPEKQVVEFSLSAKAVTNPSVVGENGLATSYGILRRTEENATYFDQFTTKILLPSDKLEPEEAPKNKKSNEDQ